MTTYCIRGLAALMTLTLISCSGEPQAGEAKAASAKAPQADTAAQPGEKGGAGRQGGGREGGRQGQGGGAGAAVAGGGGGNRGGGGGGGARGGRGGGARQVVEVTPVMRRDLTETISIVGSIAANESATVRPEISGVVRSIHFTEGQEVKKGQVLMKLDDAELRAQYNQARATAELAEANLQRTEAILKSLAATQAEMDKSRTDTESARANLELLGVRLGRTEIKAPFDGIVNSRSVSPGDTISAQTTITTIDDLSRLKVDFQVPERYLPKVKTGNRFTLRAASGNQIVTADGEVYFVSSSIDRNTRAVQVKGVINSSSGRLSPGMFANVELVLEVQRGVLTVPEAALLATAAGSQVVAVVQGSGGEPVAQFVNVKTGLRERGVVEIAPVNAGELAENQNIVASGVGSLQLFNGGRLDPRPQNAAFNVEKQ